MEDFENEQQELNEEVLNKYRTAAQITNQVIATLMKEAVAGKKIIDLCLLGDKTIKDAMGLIVTKKGKVEKGIAFPTCISVNNCAGHYSPLVVENDQTVLKEGDIVKIDLGVQIDGYINLAAHTLIVTNDTANPVTGRKADVICAAFQAAQAAQNLIRPGKKNSDVTNAIGKIAQAYKCNMVEGVLSHQMKRFVIDGNKCIISKATPTHKVEEFEFEPHQVYCVDIVVSTGDGKTREMDTKTTVFKRAVENTYLLKMKASRDVFNQVNRFFPTFPFCLRNLEDEKRAKLGITEMVKHDLVHPYPVLYEKNGEFVAQYKFTVLVLPDGTSRENNFPPPFVSSEHKIEDPSLNEILMGTQSEDKMETS